MMLAYLQRRSLRQRLALLIAISTGITALVCLLTVMATSVWIAQQRAHELTGGLARMVAEAVRDAVYRGDAAAIEERLSMLKVRGQVAGAWVLAADGRLLARLGAGAMPGEGERGGLTKGFVVADVTIRHEGRPAGLVRIQTQLGDIRTFILTVLAAVLLSALAATIGSVLLGRRIARTIAEPIQRLADTAAEIATSQDTSRRVPADSVVDEVGRAAAAFNHMLSELQRHEVALLELRVAERTRDLQTDRDRAQAASQAKSSFLSHMSHELRTPLNAVIGAAQLLDAPEGDGAMRASLVAAIRGSGTRLLSLIDDILDLSRIENGALELVREPFDPIECLHAAAATMAVAARLKNLRLICTVDPSLTHWRMGDPYRLRQILLNLLGNAVKFTEQGEVRLQVAPGVGTHGFEIRVTDSGIGMDETALCHIFEPFRQADSSTSRRFGGTGLGLAISQQLVLAMGGQISVSSQPGIGSQFVVDIPLPLAEAPVSPASEHGSEEAGAGAEAVSLPVGLRVLVAEDDAVNQLIVRTLLQRDGCRVTLVENGAQVLHRAAQQDFDLVLMDMQMPGMDGLETTRQLRAGAAGEAARRLPVLALTANAFTEDRAACMAAGMDDFLTKPIQAQALRQAMARALRASAHQRRGIREPAGLADEIEA